MDKIYAKLRYIFFYVSFNSRVLGSFGAVKYFFLAIFAISMWCYGKYKNLNTILMALYAVLSKIYLGTNFVCVKYFSFFMSWYFTYLNDYNGFFIADPGLARSANK